MEEKNKKESVNLEKRVAELRAQLEKQSLEKQSLEDKLDTFEEMKSIMPEASKGIAICRRESDHPGLRFVKGERYDCVKAKDHNKIVSFNFKAGGHQYMYHTPTFYRFFDYENKDSEVTKGDDFLKEMRRNRGKY
jgi:hypothetical protein